MKILSPKEYQVLKQKADNFDAIVAKIVAKNSELKADDVTVEIINQLVDNATGDDELSAQLDQANETIKTQKQTIDANAETISKLTTEIEELKGTGATPPANVDKKEELDSKEKDIASFADANKGDTASILDFAQKEGLI
ncbi:MAG: hypothetical protein LBJ72_11945 [Dysgonamonadaceae bacterium]|jgi:chromosome segregation ATPase|nr:hypothetical protein [Dysgonamonadaceae bacterium]